MKILMLTWEYPPRIVGGIARVVHDLSKRLIKDGHEVTVITYKEGDVPYYENDKGVEVYRVDNYMINPNNFIDWIMQLNFNMVAKANELMEKLGKFDVIHAHDWLVAYSAKTLKNSYGIPLVSTIHATEAGRNSGIHDETQRYVNDTEWLLTYESSEVIVNSKYMKNELQRLFGLPYEKINVISNGVNINSYTGIEKDYDFRRQFAADNEKIVISMNSIRRPERHKTQPSNTIDTNFSPSATNSTVPNSAESNAREISFSAPSTRSPPSSTPYTLQRSDSPRASSTVAER